MNQYLIQLLAALILTSSAEGRRGGFLFIFTENGGFGIWTILGIAVSVGLSVLCCCLQDQKADREREEDLEHQSQLQQV